MSSPSRSFNSSQAAVQGAAQNGGASKSGALGRAAEWLSPVNLHLAGLALLVLLNIYLLVHLALAWSGAYRDNADALAQQTIELKGAEIAARPLRGLDVKLAHANADANEFYQERIPTKESTVLSEMGALAKRDGVKLTRVQYSSAQPVGSAATKQDIGAAEAGLTEVRMDASLSGDYRPLVHFINGLERDRVFFLIGGVALTGQQSGVVNLRMKLTAYLRQPTPAELAEGYKPEALSGDIVFDSRGDASDAGASASAPPAMGGRP